MNDALSPPDRFPAGGAPVRRPRRSRTRRAQPRLPLRASEALEDRERVDPDFDALDVGDLVREVAGVDRAGMAE